MEGSGTGRSTRGRRESLHPNSFAQLGGCLKRMANERKRAVRGTLCEFCSHLILILILVFGYLLSQVEDKPQETYTTITIPPRSFYKDDFGEGALSLYYEIMNGPLIVPNLDQYIAIGDTFRAVAGPFRRALQSTGFGNSFTNLLNRGSLHFSPNDEKTWNLIRYLNKSYSSFSEFEVVVHDSEREGINFILEDGGVPAFALISLLQIQPDKVNYKIRQNYTTLPNTNDVMNIPAIGVNSAYHQYFFSGFLSLQKAVDEWVYDYLKVGLDSTVYPQQCTGMPPQAVFAPYPTFSYNQNPFYGSVGFLLGLVMVMSTLYPMSKLTKSIVEEKESKMRELMMIMGLPEWAYRASWFLMAFILFFWITISTLFVTSISFLTRSDPVILFVYFFLFCMSEITFAFLVSVFFSNAKLAAIAGPVILFGAILPRYIFYTSSNNEVVLNKVLACFLSPTAFSFGADIIADYEYANVGVQFSNLFTDRFNFGTVLIMLFIDFYIYAFLAWYLDQVLPHENGTPKHPLFIFQYQYWCSCICGNRNDDSDFVEGDGLDFDVMPEFHDAVNHPTIEPISVDNIHLAKIRIKGLGKQYPDGKVAVRNLNLSMLQGQITCLLGHNGAGKTTTLSMLTGLTQATTGDVSIFGHSLRRELLHVRRITGLCPQLNVLFPLLTVQEHLMFFGCVKGLYGSDLQDAIDDVLLDVGLVEKRHTLSQALSGGMKRKLCLAMALIGDPKFILLDEPTSGMDPYSRRSTWELLQRNKENRVILLTTHFMDEADTLADRIAIMSEGTLLCAGSSLFLKSKFGVGFLLSMSKTVPDAPVANMTEAIQAIIPNAAVHSSVAGEVIFKLPLGTSPLFGRLFQMLQEQSSNLLIGSYGISITTLEQVFIMLAHHKQSEDLQDKDSSAAGAPLLPEYRFCTFLMNGITRAFNALKPVPATPSMVMQPQHAFDHSTDFSALDNGTLIEPSHPPDQISRDIENEKAVVLGGGIVNAHTVDEIVDLSSPPAVTKSETAPESTAGNLVDSGTGGIANVTVFIQLYELYMKRIIVLKRDLKGFFFQILVPAFLIVLIMLILTVRLNISGNTLILNGNMFSRYGNLNPNFIMAGAQVDTNPMAYSLRDFASRRSFKMESPEHNVYNSSGMSNYLLNMDHFRDRRQGAFIFDDEIRLQISVDWNWTKNTLSEFPISGKVVRRSLKAAGLMGTTYTTSVPLTSFLDATGNLIVNDDVTLPNFNVPDTVVTLGGNRIVIPSIFSNLMGSNGSALITTNVTTQMINFLMSGSTALLQANEDQIRLLMAFFPQLGNVTQLLNGEGGINSFITTVVSIGVDALNSNTGNLVLVLPSFINLPNINITIPGFSFSEVLANVNVALTNTGIVVDLSLSSPDENNANNLLLSLFSVQNTFLWKEITTDDILPFLPTGNFSQVIGIPNAYTILHNTTSPHGLAALQGQFLEAHFQMCMNANASVPSMTASSSNSSGDEYQYSQYLVKNHPLPITPEQSLFIQLILSLLASIFILVPLCYIPASFVAFLVKERVSKSKHLQIVSGVSPYLYWIAAYLWDMTLFSILSLFIIACLHLFGKDVARVFIGNQQQTLGVTCLLLVYGASCIPLAYLYSFAFVNFSTAQIAIMVINFMTGFVMVLAYYVMISVPYTQSAAKIIVHVFRFFPAYNVGEGLINISTNYFEQTLLDSTTGVWTWEVIGRSLVFMFVEAIGYMTMVLLSETSFVKTLDDRILRWRGIEKYYPPPRTTPADDDVLAEEEKVKRLMTYIKKNLNHGADSVSVHSSGLPTESDMEVLESQDNPNHVVLLLDNVIKSYPSLDRNVPPKYAVRGMSLACYDNERFGLLGINGAGKTTTLSILTGEISATAGEVYIGGRPLSDPKTMTMLGYCPQVDPLLELMNAYETLWFYGRIRGITKNILSQRIDSLITQTGLTPHAHRPSGTYSGGNKRKLSLAVALIGDPKVLLLDEPSTGMDPEARRQMWNVIQQVSNERTVILVSHSMEEIEALCTRVGVMVSGRMQCLGAIQHLKGKFGTGYQVEIRCHVDKVNDCMRLCNHFLCDPASTETASATGTGEGVVTGDAVTQSELLPHAEIYDVEEEHGGYFRLHVHGRIDLAVAFDSLEKNKDLLQIYDYNISQCSLEQVFIRFAKHQEEETALPRGVNHRHHHHNSNDNDNNNMNCDNNTLQNDGTNPEMPPIPHADADISLPTNQAVQYQEKKEDDKQGEIVDTIVREDVPAVRDSEESTNSREQSHQSDDEMPGVCAVV